MKRKNTEQFISEARLVHGDKYDYSKVEYVNNTTKVCIICPIHGEFWQIPKQHLKGCGCYKCANINNGKSYILPQNEVITRFHNIHNDKYDYSKVKYSNYHKKVCIVCPTHGEFWQTPSNHINGQGCPLCGINKMKGRISGINDAFSKSTSRSYRTWTSMMDRCYNHKTQQSHPTYKDCYVCNEWLTFSNFDKWFKEHYVDEWEIDKDLLVRGNKEYAPDKCCFVPQKINSFLTNKKSNRGKCVLGVYKTRYSNKFVATLGCLDKPYLGTFNTEIEAFNAYKKAKENKARVLATEYKDQLEPRVYEALYNYQVEITD